MTTRSHDIEIIPYQPDLHAGETYEIWEHTLGGRWPITPGIFWEVTEATHAHVEIHQLAARNLTGRILGYLGSQIRPRKHTEASIILVMVDPPYQRQGIGTKLLRTAIETFEREEMAIVHMGGHAELPFWPGIPTCLPSAKQFFEKHGWEIYENSYDLVMDLKDFVPPDWVGERARRQGIHIRTAKAEDVPALLRFLEEEFDWRRWFVREVEERGTGNILIAGKGSQVVGTLRMSDVYAPDWTGRQWRSFLGEDMGALGAVGVKASERNQGIGLSMVAEASRQLRDRGIRNCFVHWTWLVEWYGRLGYQVWQEYGMAKKHMGEM